MQRLKRMFFGDTPRYPHHGQILLWCLLYIACRRTYQTLPVSGQDDAMVAVTVFSFLPDSMVTDQGVLEWARLLLNCSAVLWALNLFVPWSSFVCATMATFVVAIYYESSSNIGHTFHLTTMLLIVHAAWYQIHHVRLRERLREGRFWTQQHSPAWLAQLSLVVVVLFHWYAGLSKIFVSGFAWADGVSLQVWIHLWGHDNVLTRFLLENRGYAQGLQVLTLVVECGAILALLSRRWSWLVGFGLLGLYGGILTSFAFSFQYNALIVILVMTPTYECIDWLRMRLSGRLKCPETTSRIGSIVKTIISRLDILGIVRRDR